MDTLSLREEVPRLQLPGFRLRMGACWCSARSTPVMCLCSRGWIPPSQCPATACCPCLRPQPWPLPGCNRSLRTVMVNSSLTTKVPFTLPLGAGCRATLALAESRGHVHDHKGSNRQTYPDTPLQRLPLLFSSGGRHQGTGPDQGLQGLQSWGRDSHVGRKHRDE